MSDVRSEARRLTRDAEAAGLRLRLIGSLGVREHCAAAENALDAVGRVPAQDIDYVAPLKDEKRISELFGRLEYAPDPAVAYSREYGIQRLIFHHPSEPIKVDVFLDVLHMAHTIDFRKRLPEMRTTATITDLLLAKLQIHEITEKDLQDLVAILATHDVGGSGEETIDLDRLRQVLTNDWGFEYTAVQNLKKVGQWVEANGKVPPSTRAATVARAQELTSAVTSWPKGLRWRMRAAVGTRLRWYEEVEEVERK